MDIKFDAAGWHYESDGGLWLKLHVLPESAGAAKKFVSGMAKRLYTAALKVFRAKRSLDANAYMWVLLQKMAEVIGNTDKDALYLEMLERYGVFTHIIVKEEAAQRLKAEWRTVRELGKVAVRGKTGVQLQCYYGSSTYDTKEMSVLIDGVVSECWELGIEVMTPAELALLKEDWGREKRTA